MRLSFTHALGQGVVVAAAEVVGGLGVRLEAAVLEVVELEEAAERFAKAPCCR